MSALLCMTCYLLGQTTADVRFGETAGKVVVVARLPAALQSKVPTGKLPQEQGEQWLRVCFVEPQSGKVGPPMLGTYERVGPELVFRPRFPLESGQLYRAFLGPEGGAESAEYRVPEPTGTEPPRVVKIYPTGDELPANHLRFHVYFSQPMRGGQEIFKQFAILDEDGTEVLDPWLHDELWDEDERCLILYFHPGRIKWGVLLRELLGPVLRPQRRYTLVVRGEMLDANGRRLGKDVTKTFRTTAEDRQRIKVEEWMLAAPAVGTSEPLHVFFPKAIDHKSLARFLTITDESGKRVRGTFEVGKAERSWCFRPAQPWSVQEYRLIIDSRLEDVAGNTPLRPFDVDLNTPPAGTPCLHRTFRPVPAVKG
jgi:hypothetical protein